MSSCISSEPYIFDTRPTANLCAHVIAMHTYLMLLYIPQINDVNKSFMFFDEVTICGKLCGVDVALVSQVPTFATLVW